VPSDLGLAAHLRINRAAAAAQARAARGAISPSEVDNCCNPPGYSGVGDNGSVRDYYHDVSKGLLTYTNYVPDAYYHALHLKAYYADPNVPYGQRARELIVEALTVLNSQGVDFSQYDANGGQVIDGVSCFCAGYSNSAWAQGFWPHAGLAYYCADGVCTQRHQMSDMESAARLQTLGHGSGHALMDWAGVYDYAL
jgi:M6 family metalloprotease-like protein